MDPMKEDALARRRAQNREAQRKFRLKHNQRKSQVNAPQSPPRSTSHEAPRSPPTESITSELSNIPDAIFPSTSGPCVFGDISLLDFSNIEGLLTPDSDSDTTYFSAAAHMDDTFGSPTGQSTAPSEPRSSPSTSIDNSQNHTPNPFCSNNLRRSRADSGVTQPSSSIGGSSINGSISSRLPHVQSTTSSNMILSALKGAKSVISPPEDQPNQSGDNGWVSALHIAAEKGHVRIVRILLQHGVNCNEKDSDGFTPLIHAIVGDHEDVVTSLLDHNARIGEIDKQSRTALHWAVLKRRESLLRVLLEHCHESQTLIDCYDVDGKTPLHSAVDTGFEAGVHCLLQNGANLNYRARKC